MATDSPHLRASRDGQSPHYWHLAQDSTGVAMTDLEYAILRVFEAFGRWQSECLAAVSGASITGPENVLLHVVAMKGRAKTIHDVMLLTNRQDTPNVQYGLRKLMKLGFIKKRGSARAGVFYQTTEKGEKVCKDYADLRKKLLLRAAKNVSKFESTSKKCCSHLETLEKIYTIVGREAATFFRR
jgi:predicted MarR family transcription regulator